MVLHRNKGGFRVKSVPTFFKIWNKLGTLVKYYSISIYTLLVPCSMFYIENSK